MQDAIRVDLERAGVGVNDLGLCSGCLPDLFYSHRKQGPLTGRNLASVVMRRPDECARYEIRDRLAAVHENIENALERSGRGEEQVRILVATKYYHPEQLFALAEAGVDLIGENRAEDLLDKQELFGDRFEWHFIGHLQRRKAKVVVPRVTLVHSVDSVRLIEELAKERPRVESTSSSR